MSTAAQIGIPTQTVRSATYQEIYSNHAKLALTPFDIQITLGHTSEQPPGVPVIEDDVVIRLSPQMCKNLSISLSMALKAWESQFGTIILTGKKPEDVVAAVQAMVSKEG